MFGLYCEDFVANLFRFCRSSGLMQRRPLKNEIDRGRPFHF